jgi:hypothetical protein
MGNEMGVLAVRAVAVAVLHSTAAERLHQLQLVCVL